MRKSNILRSIWWFDINLWKIIVKWSKIIIYGDTLMKNKGGFHLWKKVQEENYPFKLVQLKLKL